MGRALNVAGPGTPPPPGTSLDLITLAMIATQQNNYRVDLPNVKALRLNNRSAAPILAAIYEGGSLVPFYMSVGPYGVENWSSTVTADHVMLTNMTTAPIPTLGNTALENSAGTITSGYVLLSGSSGQQTSSPGSSNPPGGQTVTISGTPAVSISGTPLVGLLDAFGNRITGDGFIRASLDEQALVAGTVVTSITTVVPVGADVASVLLHFDIPANITQVIVKGFESNMLFHSIAWGAGAYTDPFLAVPIMSSYDTDLQITLIGTAGGSGFHVVGRRDPLVSSIRQDEFPPIYVAPQIGQTFPVSGTVTVGGSVAVSSVAGTVAVAPAAITPLSRVYTDASNLVGIMTTYARPSKLYGWSGSVKMIWAAGFGITDLDATMEWVLVGATTSKLLHLFGRNLAPPYPPGENVGPGASEVQDQAWSDVALSPAWDLAAYFPADANLNACLFSDRAVGGVVTDYGSLVLFCS